MIEQLTPISRPLQLTDHAWMLIVRCFRTPRDYYFDYMNVYECLRSGECSRAWDRGVGEIELPWILFVRSKQWAWPVPQDAS
ncbi:hypothetical protein J2S43_001441 [Catenuloplanes nepalensis]|uniref:Transposase n=1 Tax=Catenuloplanes nepalensis TaxID=587533 RepID=A0ABT9MNB2_9ACTN|nr:hypothetical protein [Catenuloplanes nepalensis]MDP9792929.1 hypothetical protein [Catenuloplanes nepalensis]